MDLDLYFRVIWRFRVLVAFGLLVATLLAVLSTAQIHFSHGRPTLAYRQNEIWQSSSTLLIGQPRVRWGPAVVPTPTTRAPTASTTAPNATTTDPNATTNLYDPLSFSARAAFYARLANSDSVRKILARVTGNPRASITCRTGRRPNLVEGRPTPLHQHHR